MWISMTIWAVLSTSFLISTASAYNSYADFETSKSAQYPSSHKGSSDYRWNKLDEDSNSYLFGTDTQRDLSGRYLDLNSWAEGDSATLSRQLFGDKSAESSETMRSTELEEDEAPKSKRESHSLSIVNPLDVLRQRLMLEMARRRMKENQDQIRQNEVILKNLGKRANTRSTHEGDQPSVESRTNQDYLRRLHVSNSGNYEV